jgi:hypothetical protein
MEIVPNRLLIHVGDQASAASRIAHVKFLVILPPKPSPGAEAPEPPGPHLSLYRPLVGRELRRISWKRFVGLDYGATG